MADIQLKNLNEITNTSQLTSTKNLLIFDNSTNAGNRISLTTLANSISDQTITGLAGTNQSIKSAIDALNSKLTLTANNETELYTMLSNAPSAVNALFRTYGSATSFLTNNDTSYGIYGRIIKLTDSQWDFEAFNINKQYIGRVIKSGSTYSCSCVIQPTRAEMDDLKNRTTAEVLFEGETSISTANTEVSFSKTADSDSLLKLILNSAAGNPSVSRSVCLVTVGDTAYFPVQLGSSLFYIRVNVATNKITFIGTSATSLYLYKITRV